MNASRFTTTIGPDSAIYQPAGVVLPEGELDVKSRCAPMAPS